MRSVFDHVLRSTNQPRGKLQIAFLQLAIRLAHKIVHKLPLHIIKQQRGSTQERGSIWVKFFHK